MKQISSDFAAHLAGAATTLANCWRLTRADGTVMGFTDHDWPIILNGVTYAASTGLTASQVVASADLSTGGGDVSGALASAAITEADIAAGLYDGATIDVFLVNWATPTQYLQIRSGLIGEIKRQDQAFVAEVRSLATVLDQQRGRIYQHRCDADLGDSRCTINLNQPIYSGTGTVVSSASPTQLVASGLSAFALGWFARGRLVFTAGANLGFAVEVKLHTSDPSGAFIALWQPAPNPIRLGDVFTVTAGCDKLINTCDTRFNNAVNFRGFPHIPGSDFLLANPALTAQPNNGTALVS
jgi:uncharacterized phage protein (TIGR02218 family)